MIAGNEVRVGFSTLDFNFSERYVSDMAIALGEPNQLEYLMTATMVHVEVNKSSVATVVI